MIQRFWRFSVPLVFFFFFIWFQPDSEIPTVQAGGSDPGAAGPLAVTRREYNFGDSAYTPPGFPAAVEVAADVHYPTDLSGGPFPLILFMHGRHVTCFSGTLGSLQ